MFFKCYFKDQDRKVKGGGSRTSSRWSMKVDSKRLTAADTRPSTDRDPVHLSRRQSIQLTAGQQRVIYVHQRWL